MKLSEVINKYDEERYKVIFTLRGRHRVTFKLNTVANKFDDTLSISATEYEYATIGTHINHFKCAYPKGPFGNANPMVFRSLEELRIDLDTYNKKFMTLSSFGKWINRRR